MLDVSMPRADVYGDSKVVSRIYTTINAGRTVERAVVGHIVYQQDTHCTAVVSGGDSAETLLTSGVPLKQTRVPVSENSIDNENTLTICNFIRLPSSSIVRILKSMPIVVIKEGVHASSQNLSRRQDFPTPIKVDQSCTYRDRDDDKKYPSLL